MKGWITSQTADHFRLPLRMQLAEMIPSDSKFLEVGCGTGDLFYLVSQKISFGLGLDKSLTLVRYAQQKMRKQEIKNVAIRRARFPETLSYVAKFDVGVACLFFSNLPNEKAESTLKKMCELCPEILIAEFDPAHKMKTSKLITESAGSFDKENSKAFRRSGGVEALADRCGLEIMRKVKGPYKGLFIYTVASEANTAHVDKRPKSRSMYSKV
jgi:SAM-dependent methyltransferase